jgi:adenosylcobyric acid synthase
MHIGRTTGAGTARPLLDLKSSRGPHPDGAVSADGRVAGCYVHGMFAGDAFRHAFLKAMRPHRQPSGSYEAGIDDTLDALADHLEANLDLDVMLAIAGDR